MPTGYNNTQKPAGKVKPMPGVDNSVKTMGSRFSTTTKPAFKIKPQEYKGNAVINANK